MDGNRTFAYPEAGSDPLELGVDFYGNRVFNGLVGGASSGMNLQRPLGLSLLILRHPHMIGDPDFGDLDGLVDGADIPFDRRVEVIGVGADLARFQRAGKGAGQSTRHRRDHVVERRRVFAFGGESVEFGYAPVDAIVKRLLEILNEGPAKRRLVLHDLDVAGMHNVCHG